MRLYREIKYLLILQLLVLFSSCGERGTSHIESSNYQMSYAKCLSIEKSKEYTQVSILDPWDSTKVLHKYILVSKSRELPTTLPEGTVVRTPLENIIVYTAVHCSAINALNREEAIIGVCESEYIELEFVQKGVESGAILDLGVGTMPNIEKMIELSPEAIISSPIDNSGYGRVEKLGVPIIECVDYMETTPLGRSEWIKLYGLLFEQEALADSLFRSIEKSYNEIKELTKNISNKPTLLTEYKVGSAWYIPGGESYMANLYKDAGADYLWSDTKGKGSIPLSVEQVIERGVTADIWIVKYNRDSDMSYRDLKEQNSLYSIFEPFKKRNIFGCNAKMTTYYQDLPIHPEYILKDLMWIFHPELVPDYTPKYFKKLEE